jgi:hypothetical protein
MSLLNAADLSRIAGDAARLESPDLRVVGVILGAARGEYVEVILNVEGCHTAPCQVIVSTFRNLPEEELRTEISRQLRRHLAQHWD